jgi:hypothetical protein
VSRRGSQQGAGGHQRENRGSRGQAGAGEYREGKDKGYRDARGGKGGVRKTSRALPSASREQLYGMLTTGGVRLPLTTTSHSAAEHYENLTHRTTSHSAADHHENITHGSAVNSITVASEDSN